MDYNDHVRHLLTPIDNRESSRRAEHSVWDDVEPWLGTSVEQRADALVGVLRLADAILDGTPRGPAYREWQDERSAEAEALWLRLVAEHRGR